MPCLFLILLGNQQKKILLEHFKWDFRTDVNRGYTNVIDSKGSKVKGMPKSKVKLLLVFKHVYLSFIGLWKVCQWKTFSFKKSHYFTHLVFMKKMYFMSKYIFLDWKILYKSQKKLYFCVGVFFKKNLYHHH